MQRGPPEKNSSVQLGMKPLQFVPGVGMQVRLGREQGPDDRRTRAAGRCKVQGGWPISIAGIDAGPALQAAADIINCGCFEEVGPCSSPRRPVAAPTVSGHFVTFPFFLDVRVRAAESESGAKLGDDWPAIFSGKLIFFINFNILY